MTLQAYLDHRVLLILQDGRAIVVSNYFTQKIRGNYNLSGRPRWFRPKIKHCPIRLQRTRLLNRRRSRGNSPRPLPRQRRNSVRPTPYSYRPSNPLTQSCLIGEIDEEIDKSVDLSSIRAEPIPPIRYG